MVEEEKKKMTYAGLVIDADEEQLYVLYRAQVYALPMEDEYEDFENGKWVSLVKEGEEIVRAEESQQLEKLNRWNARIVDDELVVDVNVLKRDFDAYPMRKIEKDVEKEDGKRSNLWSYELNDIRDPKNLLGHGDIPAETFYRCTVSLSINFDFLPELETNILESDSVEKKLLRILHISAQELQIYSSKAPWCYLYRADLPPPPLDAGEIKSNNMRLGIIARKIIYKDGDVRYFLWSQSTGAIPVVMPRKLNTFKEWRFKVGTIYRFQTRLVGDEICAVRLQPTDDAVPCIVNTTRLFKRTTEDLLIKASFDLNETRFLSKLEQNHPFFGQLCIEQTDLQQIVENNPDMTSAAGYLKFYFVFNFFEKDESSSCGQWVPVTHQHPAKPTVRREWG